MTVCSVVVLGMTEDKIAFPLKKEVTTATVLQDQNAFDFLCRLPLLDTVYMQLNREEQMIFQLNASNLKMNFNLILGENKLFNIEKARKSELLDVRRIDSLGEALMRCSHKYLEGSYEDDKAVADFLNQIQRVNTKNNGSEIFNEKGILKIDYSNSSFNLTEIGLTDEQFLQKKFELKQLLTEVEGQELTSDDRSHIALYSVKSKHISNNLLLKAIEDYYGANLELSDHFILYKTEKDFFANYRSGISAVYNSNALKKASVFRTNQIVAKHKR